MLGGSHAVLSVGESADSDSVRAIDEAFRPRRGQDKGYFEAEVMS